MNIFFYLFILGFLTESITNICLKATISHPIRAYIISKMYNTKIGYLLTCGYCFSFWVSLLLLTLSYTVTTVPILVESGMVNFVVILLVVHRLSNIIHGTVDKYFDKQYDIRYNKVN
jgi:Protein of unknown function (DUF1360)